MRYTCNKKSFPLFSKDCKNCPEYKPCVKDGSWCFVGAMGNEKIVSGATVQNMQSTAMPVLKKHDYRDIKIAEGTTVTIDLEELKENMRKEIYGGAFDVFRSAT